MADSPAAQTSDELATPDVAGVPSNQRLAEFLDLHQLGLGEIEISPLGDGHSNITLLVKRGGHEFVLRRPPHGQLQPGTHDVLREARLLSAIGTWEKSPNVLATCADTAVIGAPFYLMERAKGIVPGQPLDSFLDSRDARRKIGLELAQTLAELHGLDWLSAGVAVKGKGHNYLASQVRRFSALWELNKTRELLDIVKIRDWLNSSMPTSGLTTIVHGDYRLGNTLFMEAEDEASTVKLSAVLDWEMATVGDPLADLGYLTMFWVQNADPDIRMFELSSLTREAGFLSRGELIGAYEEHAKISANHIRWYQVLALWKLAILMEGNFKRTQSGMSEDPFLKGFDRGVPELLKVANEVAFSGISPIA